MFLDLIKIQKTHMQLSFHFFCTALSQVSPTIFGDGLTSRDFTYVDNVVQANIKSFFEYDNLNFHEVFNVALGKRTTLNELGTY